MKDLFEYNNFWLIWINCAGSAEGISLFKIQTSWDIKTNYLYHNERSIKKPLFKAMIDGGYLKQGKNGLVADFEWIPEYILKKHELKPNDIGWSLNGFIIEHIPEIHEFIKKNHVELFDSVAVKKLFQSDINTIKQEGYTILDNIILFVFVSTLIPFCKRYDAEIVIRMVYTIFAFSSRQDFLSYLNVLRNTLQSDSIPNIIPNEGTLVKVLCPVEFSSNETNVGGVESNNVASDTDDSSDIDNEDDN